MEITEIPVNLIDDPQDPMRDKLNENGIDELLQSVKKVGLLQPITVVSRGDHFEVVAGHRRLAAFRMGNIALIPAMVITGSEEEIDIARVHENLFREDVDPVDEARHYALLRGKHKKSISEIADLIKKSDSYVRSRLDLVTYPDYILSYVKEGKLNISAAYWMNKIKNESVRRQYVEFAARQGVNAIYAKAWYESWERGALAYNPADQLPPQVEGVEGTQETLIVCLICGAETPLIEHMLGYAHPECFEEIARVRAANEYQRETAEQVSNTN